MTTKTQKIEMKEYNLIGVLDDEEYAVKSLAEDYSGHVYLSDAISETGDSFIPIYNSDIWKDASLISEYIEEAIWRGLAPTDGRDVDLMRIFQAGYYTYYTQSLYDNLDAVAFNYITKRVNKALSDIEVEVDLDAIEDEIEAITKNTDNNDAFSHLEDKASDIIQDIVDGIY